MSAFDIVKKHIEPAPVKAAEPAATIHRESLFDDGIGAVHYVTAWRICQAWRRLGVKLNEQKLARQLCHPVFNQPTPLADAALKAAEEARLETLIDRLHRYRCTACGSESISRISWPCPEDNGRCDFVGVTADGEEIWD